ncbi:MAG: BrnT family toxin [Methylococcales bacterium]
MDFEWDENKREANLAKHGLDLAAGVWLFDGRPVYSYPSPRNDEHRVVTVGYLNEIAVAVIWTTRENIIRLISMRRARDVEKRKYQTLYS